MIASRLIQTIFSVALAILTGELFAGEAEWNAAMSAGRRAIQQGDPRSALRHFETASVEAEPFGIEDRRLLVALSGMVSAYMADARYNDAEYLAKRLLPQGHRMLRGSDPQGAMVILSLVGQLNFYLGRFSEAESLFKTIASEASQAGKRYDARVLATALTNLTLVYQALGRYQEAESAGRRALEIGEPTFGRDNPGIASMLGNLALVYSKQGRFSEAEPLFRRAINMVEKARGTRHPDFAIALNNLAQLLIYQKRLSEAEPYLVNAVSVFDSVLGFRHTSTAMAYSNLAMLYVSMGKSELGESILEKAKASIESLFGKNHVTVGQLWLNLSTTSLKSGNYAIAEERLRKALAIVEVAVGLQHPDVAEILDHLAFALGKQGKLDESLSAIRRSTAIRRSRLIPDGGPQSKKGLVEQQAFTDRFSLHVDLLWLRLRSGTNAPEAIIAESIEAVQLAKANDASAQLANTAARHAAATDELARDIRIRQDRATALQAAEESRMRELSKPTSERSELNEGRLQVLALNLTKQLREIDEKLRKDYPQFWELVSPEPVSLTSLKTMIGQGEAMLQFLVLDDYTYVWHVDQNQTELIQVPITRRELETLVNKLRSQLDLNSGNPTAMLEMPFPVEASYRLYEKLLQPFERKLKQGKHLFIVPDGPLTSLPFSVLLTESPSQEAGKYDNLLANKWLVKEVALTTLPSIGALKALRSFERRDPARTPFIGFGDPVLEGGKDVARGTPATFFARGPVADVNAVRKLSPLPEATFELTSIAKTLGADTDVLYLGARATERQVKRTDFQQYRNIAFATHGLLAGDLQGLAEPALVLTPPTMGSDEDDGLLTSSEISKLKLNADWVILSACNTAAPDGKLGAQGFSSLTKAFFYAGARSLLVSHWSVSSEAAAAITIGMFSESAKGHSKSEALRRSMLSLMERKDGPYFSHPAMWAPFVAVGEGNELWKGK